MVQECRDAPQERTYSWAGMPRTDPPPPHSAEKPMVTSPKQVSDYFYPGNAGGAAHDHALQAALHWVLLLGRRPVRSFVTQLQARAPPPAPSAMEACVLRRPCLLHPSHPSRCGVASRAGRAGCGMPHATQLYQHVPEKRWPIVYSPRYNITFMGLEKLHPFDAGKWGKVINFLKEEKLLSDGMLVEAREASEEDLLVVHTRRYLNELKWSFVVATITEIPPVIFLPNFLVQRKVLRPLRTQTGGTIMAGKLAVERGWAINVGGGFHHCSSDRGGGFCAYADITLAIKFLFERVEGISRATIIDLDAHQGNGHERDFMGDKRVYIMDVYNRHIYPGDRFAKEAIRRKVELEWGTEDEEYLEKVERNVRRSLQEHLPDVVVYNAGTDVLEGDRLGGLSISPAGIVKRDEVVFRVVRAHDIPILMVTSAFIVSFILPLLESGGCQSHQLSKPLTWTRPHSTDSAAPHPSAMTSLPLTGGTSQDIGEW
uniref:Histone deacetylase 11 n=1 Tax=Mus spicilegus TaxID=10103 RepID=A0A8C6GR56_MUSSI